MSKEPAAFEKLPNLARLPSNPTGGATFSFTFATPGRYDYFCALHPGMGG
jgi:plastocyanin